MVELNDIYQFDWIAIDRGYGETQLEILHKYGISNPTSGLAEKVIGYQFGQKINVRDPHTRKVDKKPLKPFMVNNSVLVFEKEKIILNHKDKLLREQLESYRIKTISVTGLPTYTDEDEHAVDALNLCLLIFEQKYGELFKSITSSKIRNLKEFDRRENLYERNVNFVEEPKRLLSTFGSKTSYDSNRSFTKNVSFNQGRGYKSMRGGF